MASYTICSKLIEYCGKRKNSKYLANILYIFTLDKPIKITRDNCTPSLVLEDYRKIADEYFEIYKWLDFLSKTRGPDDFVIVKIPKKKYNSIELYLTVCANTVGERKLLTLCKQDYHEKGWEKHAIKLFDKDEAKEELSKNAGISISATSGSIIAIGDKTKSKIDDG